MIGERVGGDNDACGMRAHMAGDALQPPRRVDELAQGFVLLVRLLHLRGLLESEVDGHPHARRHEPGDAVNVGIGHAERAPRIADRRLRPQRPERDDLGNVVTPVLIRDVPDRLLAAVVLEIHIDVRHLLALDVQEALEHQAVAQRVEVGHSQAVQRERRGRAPAHAEDDALLAGKLGDVPDDQEVIGVLRLGYDVQFVAEPILCLIRRALRVSLAEALPAEPAQVRVRVLAVGSAVLWQVERREIERDARGVRDLLRIRYRLGQVGEQLHHLLLTLQVVRVVGELESIRIVDVRVGADAQQHVVQIRIALGHVVQVVRGDERDVQVLAPAAAAPR